jgi:flagellar biosynthesis/type III secretory pathway M-ring protein FliF/YscJ
MITVGLSQHEITLITKVLDEHKVQYHIDAAGGAAEVKMKGGRGDTSFYQIEIHDGQFNSLPAQAKAKLESLGIYPEMEAPDFSDEPVKEKKKLDTVKAGKTMKNFERIFIVVMVLMLAAFVKKVIENQ